MSDSCISVLVTLNTDYKDEDLDSIIEIFRSLRFVEDARPITDLGNLERYSVKIQVQSDLRKKLWKVLE